MARRAVLPWTWAARTRAANLAIGRRMRVSLAGMLLIVIGHLEKPVIDCPDPRSLAEFYCQVLGMIINEDIGDWIVIGTRPGLRELAFQRAVAWTSPRWPNPAYPQQMHLDIRVTDADRAEEELLALGATRVPGERETGFRVFTDPIGHPFCIVFGHLED